PTVSVRRDRADAADGVDVTLHDVAAERVADAERRLEVHAAAGLETPERRPRERLGDDVEREPSLVALHDGEADAGDRDGVTDRRGGRRLARGDDQPGAVEGVDRAELANDAGEHEPKVTARAGTPPTGGLLQKAPCGHARARAARRARPAR